MKYKAVFFDLDGTLFDTSGGVYAAFAHVFGRYGADVDESVYPSFIGPPVRQTLERFFPRERAAEAHDLFRAFYGRPEVKFHAAPYRGIERVLSYCGSVGLRVYTATSKSEIMSREILGKFGMADYFDNVYGADATLGRVKKEDVLAYALNDSGEKPAECLLIGDTSYDADGAKAVGIACLAVTYGFGKKEEIAGEHIIGYAASPFEIEDILRKVL
ncbi:MAG: HAD hydrolase-like protein [Clostridiales bacterium]|jgi:phosphoglycolate phosphatase|nr:HAD hydrolase-like protein [Clostridiales bacterium]